jgi:hypothetical protein
MRGFRQCRNQSPICKILRSPGIDSKELITPGYISFRNRFLGSLKVYKVGLNITASVIGMLGFYSEFKPVHLLYTVCRRVCINGLCITADDTLNAEWNTSVYENYFHNDARIKSNISSATATVICLNSLEIPRIAFHTLYRKSYLCIPRNESARPRSQFLHSCIWEYVNCSHICECGNWQTEHLNSVLEITRPQCSISGNT